MNTQPTDEELAAIVAAVEMCWPRPVMVVDEAVPAPTGWRFSGRWWARPALSRRARPWVSPGV